MKSGNKAIFKDEGKFDVFIEQGKNSKESFNQCYGKCSVGGDIVKCENNDIGNLTIIAKWVESGNETKFANKILIDPRESRMQINNNNDDNSDVAKSWNNE